MIFVIILVGIGLCALFAKLASEILSEGWAIIWGCAAVLMAVIVFICIMFTFHGELPNGPETELKTIIVRTNDLTIATYTGDDGKPQVITSSLARDYNADPGTLVVYEQKQINSWKYPMDSEYTLKQKYDVADGGTK